MEDIGVEGGTGRGGEDGDERGAEGVTTFFDADSIAGEGHLSEVGSHCCFLFRGEYLLPMW